jgi:DNA polymerase-4
MPGPLSTTLTLVEVAEELVWNGLADHPNEREISLLAISISNLVDQPALQLELDVDGDDPRHPGSTAGATRWAVDQAMDRVRTKFGKGAVGYVSIAMSEFGSVPDEFRELAEHDV